jgi:GDP-fucose transporter C1
MHSHSPDPLPPSLPPSSVFNNLCLKYVEVSFYQVARSLTIMANIALTYLILGKTTSTTQLAGCGIVVLGFVLGTLGELGAINATFRGVVFGILSSGFVALYAIYVKKVLPAVGDDSWLLMIYNNVNASLIMPVCFVVLGELTPIAASDALFSSDYLFTLLIAGALGFLINIATFLQIQVTSPLTHNVVGTFKAAVQTVFAVVFYQNPTTIVFWLGFILTLGGSMLYFSARN